MGRALFPIAATIALVTSVSFSTGAQSAPQTQTAPPPQTAPQAQTAPQTQTAPQAQTAPPQSANPHMPAPTYPIPAYGQAPSYYPAPVFWLPPPVPFGVENPYVRPIPPDPARTAIVQRNKISYALKLTGGLTFVGVWGITAIVGGVAGSLCDTFGSVGSDCSGNFLMMIPVGGPFAAMANAKDPKPGDQALRALDGGAQILGLALLAIGLALEKALPPLPGQKRAGTMATR